MDSTERRKSKRIAKTVDTVEVNERGKASNPIEGTSSAKRKEALEYVKEKKKAKRVREDTDKVEKEHKKKGKVVDKGRKLKENKKANKAKSIRLRTTPNPLFNAMRSLSVPQQKCITKMGFEGLIGMRLDGIPSNLGYHVALNFDPQKMTINTSKGSIEINEVAIRDMIGAPMGNIMYDSCGKDDYDPTIKEEWMKQFNRDVIRQTDVSRMIVSSDDADWNFKLNFIVVFCNTMGNCKYNGSCDLNVLSRVNKETNFKDINWCEYILNRLRLSKNNWSGYDEKEFFCGPLTTLVLLYVDNIKCSVPHIKRVRPAIKGWSCDLLRMRVQAEIESGGLGLGEFNEPYVNNNENANEVNNQEDSMTNAEPPSSPVNIEEYLSFLDDTYNQLLSLKTKFNTGLDKACLKFPEESSLDDWKTKQLDFVLIEQEIGEDEIGENGGEGNEEGSEGGNKEGSEGRNQGEGNGEGNEGENEGKSEEGQEDVIGESGPKDLRNESTISVEEKDATECGDEENELDILIKNLSIRNIQNMGEKIQTEAEEQNIETFTQFLQNPDVIESFDRIVAEKTAEKEEKKKKPMIESTTNEVVMPTDSNKRRKVSASEASSAPSYSLGLTQEFGEGYATEDRMVQKDGCTHIDIENRDEGCEHAGLLVTETEKEPQQSAGGLLIRLKVDKEKLKGIQTDCETPNVNQITGLNVQNEVVKRDIKAGLQICSPYMNRKVELNEALTKEETIVSAWMFAMQGDKMDGVFQSFGGAQAPRVIFESMAPNTEICASVIDLWSCILNNEEQFRNNASPYRLFCTTTTMSDEMLPPKMKKADMVEAFTSSLKNAMTNVSEMASLKSVDMIFFPIKRSTHFYLIVFNLKNPSFVILDNSATDVPIEEKYGKLPDVLKKTLVDYLKVVQHPRMNSMSRVKPNRYKLKWRTVDNFIDCGIFVMRHMETFKGEIVSRYDSGLEKEYGAQSSQINRLRKKYLCKILLSSVNVLKYKVINQSRAFSNTGGAKLTKKMIQDARKRKTERLD